MKPTIQLQHDAPEAGRPLLVRLLLQVEGAAPADAGRVPVNLSLVLDRSGSMAGDKLEAVRQAAALVVRRLWPEDRLGVVTYDGEVNVLAEPRPVREHTDLAQRLKRLLTGGTTNLSGGWLKGREQVASGVREGGVNRVLLLTDGLANVGITSPDRLAALFRAATSRGVTTSTVGFGAGYDEDLLRDLADAGRGHTYYIERPDQAPGIFEEELEGLLSLAAQNVAVRIRPRAAARLTTVHHSYPSAREEDGALRIELGDLYASEPRRLLVELVVDPVPDAEAEVCGLTLTGDVLGGDGTVERREVELPVRVSLADGARVDPEVTKELLLQEAARAREEALERHRRGDADGALDALRPVREKLERADLDDADLREEASDLERVEGTVSAHGITVLDEKYMAQRAYDLRRDRRSGRERYRRE